MIRYQEHYDVNRILKITIGNFRETDFVWHDEKQKRNFFGFKTKKVIPAGWVNLHSIFDGYRYTTEELLNKGYALHENKIQHKPYVKIHIDFDYTFTKEFNSFDECVTYTENVKSLTDKKFDIITF